MEQIDADGNAINVHPSASICLICVYLGSVPSLRSVSSVSPW